jgi:hypothetical protein
MNGNLEHTSGGLKKRHLKKNKRGRIVSVKKSSPVGKLRSNQFFCVACRKKVVPDGNVRETLARLTGQPLLKAKCPKCDNKVCKFVSA